MTSTREIKRCEVCSRAPAERDHIRTRGAGGGDEPENIQWLCREHHQQRHRIGIKSFALKYNRPITFEFGYPKRSDL